jgi:ribulose-5-phosphate 4-epimerase/fuculose-1-phosphate aldolase
MKPNLHLLDVVALARDLPEKGLTRGQVGTVVEELDDDAFEVEFADDNGRAYAFAALKPNDVLKLRFTPATAVSV